MSAAIYRVHFVARVGKIWVFGLTYLSTYLLRSLLYNTANSMAKQWTE